MNRTRLLWTLHALVVLACLPSAGSSPPGRDSTHPGRVAAGAAAAVAAVTVAAAAGHASHRVRANT